MSPTWIPCTISSVELNICHRVHTLWAMVVSTNLNIPEQFNLPEPRLQKEVGIHYSHIVLPFSDQPFQVCFNPLFPVHKLVVAHTLMKKAAAFVPTFLFCLLLLQHTPGSEGERMLVGVHPWPVQPVWVWVYRQWGNRILLSSFKLVKGSRRLICKVYLKSAPFVIHTSLLVSFVSISVVAALMTRATTHSRSKVDLNIWLSWIPDYCRNQSVCKQPYQFLARIVSHVSDKSSSSPSYLGITMTNWSQGNTIWFG